MSNELIVDSFAGGGGASTGIEMAIGRSPDIAINHDADALAMHEANHPGTRHVREDVWKANLRELVDGRPVGLLWASPDCKHFSRAKGSKPVDKSIRSLAWVVVRWASQVRPRVIILENVREFADWGPVVPRWVCRCGWKGTEGQAVLVRSRRRCPRCDSLRISPTLEFSPDPERKGTTFRLFVNRLRGFGYRVEWRNLDAADFGAPTHRRRLFLIARCDDEVIEWPEPTHASPAKLGDQPLFSRLQPWRTAAECIEWSIHCPSIFDRRKPLAEKTLRRIALGINRYVISSPSPFLVPLTHAGDRKIPQVGEPLPTITTAARGEIALCVPTLIQTGYGERRGQSPRVPGVHKPLGAAVAGGAKHALTAAYLVKHFGGVVGVPIDRPGPTTTMRGTQNQLVAANLIHLNHGDKQWNSPEEPMRTLTTGNHAAVVYSFLVKYFGTAIGASLTEPRPTVTTKDRLGLVTVTIAGELYVIVDIGMRMLTPRELARAQGFHDSYVLTGTKTSQVARIGNSVCPPVAAALVKANYRERSIASSCETVGGAA